MTEQPHSHEPAPSPEELRRRMEHTRDRVGQSVEALADKADVTEQAQEKAAGARDRAVTAKEQAAQKAALVTDQIRDTAQEAARLVKDSTPDPVLDRAAQASELAARATARAGRIAADHTPEPVLDAGGRVLGAARSNRAPLLVGVGAALAVFLLVRRGRGGR
ncbi:DUF3618 domain-containing protein [Streptomyces sp. NPDC058655]|uniref:DUF3618 domain-containing protein n=1 Tax=unclassified Streptomyces TaxID=2593676 RepID=UPI0036619EBA